MFQMSCGAAPAADVAVGLYGTTQEASAAAPSRIVEMNTHEN